VIARKVLVVSRTTPLVRDVQAAAGAGWMVFHHTSSADVEEFVELKGPFDVLVAGSVFDSKTGMERLRQLRQDRPELPIVLALTSPFKAPLPEVVRVGAADLVELPAERRQLAAALRRAVSVRTARPSAQEEIVDNFELGQVISVASPSGGCGKTFYSTNLAYHLGRTTGRRVCLVDFDLQFGEVTAALRLRPQQTIIDLIMRGEEEHADPDSYIEEYLLAHESGFWVLPAPRHPADADRISLPDITRIVSSLQKRFDYVLVDTSAQLSEVTITALEMSTALICMATVDLPSLRNMRVFLETLQRLNIPTDRVSVVLNKVEDDMGISLDEVNEALYRKVVSILPYSREVIRSLNHGVPVMVSDPKAPISQKLALGMQLHVIGAGSAPSEVEPINESRPGPLAAAKRLLKSVGRKEDAK
jgi:pilus assembly protein CpaE